MHSVRVPRGGSTKDWSRCSRVARKTSMARYLGRKLDEKLYDPGNLGNRVLEVGIDAIEAEIKLRA